MQSTTRATQPVCVISVSSRLVKSKSARTEIGFPQEKSFEKWPTNTVAHAINKGQTNQAPTSFP